MSANGNVWLERVSGALQSGGRTAEFGGLFSRIRIFQFSNFPKITIRCIKSVILGSGDALYRADGESEDETPKIADGTETRSLCGDSRF